MKLAITQMQHYAFFSLFTHTFVYQVGKRKFAIIPQLKPAGTLLYDQLSFLYHHLNPISYLPMIYNEHLKDLYKPPLSSYYL